LDARPGVLADAGAGAAAGEDALVGADAGALGRAPGSGGGGGGFAAEAVGDERVTGEASTAAVGFEAEEATGGTGST
jgi:hypothetical protein